MSFVVHNGQVIGIDVLRQARGYIKKHHSAVLAETDVVVGDQPRWVHCRKGTRSLHINERIFLNHKQTKELVDRYERAL